MRHLVLFFREQPLAPEQHLALGRRFGPLHVHPAAPYAEGNPELMLIHTDRDSFRHNGEDWHSDVSSDAEPPMASILHLHRVPERGGDTLFANMYSAYESLSQPLRRLLDGLTALHQWDYAGVYGDHPPQRQVPSAEHPVVRRHPVTGRRALFVNRVFVRRIVGLEPAESRALLDFLFEHLADPRFQCRFRWQENSVALWDNRCAQHRAIWDYYPQTRSGIRVTVKGSRPSG